MDGSTSGFLRDVPPASARHDVFGLGRSDGILYVEDFDAPPEPAAEQTQPPPEPDPKTPLFGPDDLAAAREAGRLEGLQEALADAQLVQAQVQAAAIQSLSDAVAAAHGVLERVVAFHAEETARTVLGILQAAIPAAMSRHARGEITAVIAALLPGLRCEPDLRIRAHPELADFVRDTLIGLLAEDGGVLSVCADPAMAPGDIAIFWEDGQARRDTAAIYATISDALAPLGLPAMEEICGGKRS